MTSSSPRQSAQSPKHHFLHSLTPPQPPSTSSPTSRGPHIICAGLWRTATSSLRLALESPEYLNVGPCMHGVYLIADIPKLKLACLTLNEPNRAIRHKQLKLLFDDFTAAADFPAFAVLEDLLDLYPDAKVVLNCRSSAEAWERSVRDSLRFFSTGTYLWLCGMWPQSYWHHRLYVEYKKLMRKRFGDPGLDVFSTGFYGMHDGWVRRVCKERGVEMLEWQVGMGWDGLAEYVGAEVPEGQFPRINEAAGIAELARYLILKGLLSWLGILGLPVMVLFVWWSVKL